LGARDARVAVRASVSSSRGAELEIAEVLLHPRPVSEISEFRLLATEIARMEAPDSHAAMLACLGDTKAWRAVLEALTAEHGDDGAIARVLLHHRPMTDTAEFRAVAAGIGRMTSLEDRARAIAGAMIRSDIAGIDGGSLHNRCANIA